MNAFEVTQVCVTARLAGLKVLVRSVCVLAALLAVTASLLTALHVIPLSGSGNDGTQPLAPVSWLHAAEGAVAALSVHGRLGLAFVMCAGVAVMVGLRASLEAVRTRHPWSMAIAQGALLLCAYLLWLLTSAANYESHIAGLPYPVASELARPVFAAAPWVTAAALALLTPFLLWRVLVERLLSWRWAGLALLVSAAFGAALMTLLHDSGVSSGALPAPGAVWMLWSALLPLLVCLLAPWSLARVRHT
jgi:hypothetical protein